MHPPNLDGTLSRISCMNRTRPWVELSAAVSLVYNPAAHTSFSRLETVNGEDQFLLQTWWRCAVRLPHEQQIPSHCGCHRPTLPFEVRSLRHGQFISRISSHRRRVCRSGSLTPTES